MIEETKQRMEPARRGQLGRGLSALFGDADDDYTPAEKGGRPANKVPIEFLKPGPFQPRRRFDEHAIQGLADSIRERGIVQPLVVRPDPKAANAYQIICGERRWRAAQMVGLHELPVQIEEMDDRKALETSLVENIQREDLTPLEEAEGYRRLMDEFRYTQETLGDKLGKSRSHIANMLRLLSLPEAIKLLVQDGSLSAGHARALLTAKDPGGLAEQVVKKGLNVRQTEQLVKEEATPREAPVRSLGDRVSAAVKDADIVDLEKELTAHLGLKVTVTPKGKGGTVAIEYKSLDQLDSVLGRLKAA